MSRSRGNNGARKRNKRRNRRRTRRKERELLVAWCNVAKGRAQHITLLQLCWARGVDVVHVQEPSVGKDTTTQNHPGYESYAPMDSWNGLLDGPRVMSYVRRGKRINAQQKRPIDTRDINCLVVNGRLMMNIYRCPRTDPVLDFAINFDYRPNSIVGGDWNLCHPMFEPGVRGRDRGKDVVE